MYRLFFVGFCLVALLAVGGVDYFNQTRKADIGVMDLGLMGYKDNLTRRFGDQKKVLADAKLRRDLRTRPMRDLLPEPAEGWTRRDWTQADAAVLEPRQDPTEGLPQDMLEEPMLKALLAMDQNARTRGEKREIYVYEKGDELISMRLTFIDADVGGPAGMAMQIVLGNLEAMSGKEGYAVVQGVAFRQETGMFGIPDPTAQASGRRVFTGKLGKQIELTVRARASDETILALLDSVDFDRLNFILDQPMAGVGSNAPKIAPDRQKAVADARIQAESADVVAAGADMERQLIALGAALAGEPAQAPAADDVTSSLKAALAAAAAIQEQETAAPVDGIVSAEAAPASKPEGGLFSRLFGFGGKKAEAEAPGRQGQPLGRGRRRLFDQGRVQTVQHFGELMPLGAEPVIPKCRN